MLEYLKITWFTQNNNLFEKTQIIMRQSAGNQRLNCKDNQVGSSETVRETLKLNDLYF